MGIKNTVITLFFMGLVTVFLLMLVGISTFLLELGAEKAMMLLICVYIIVGVTGGILHGILERIRMKIVGRRTNLLWKMASGAGIGTIYMLILVVISVTTVKASVDDFLRLFAIWLVVCGSCILGKIFIGGNA